MNSNLQELLRLCCIYRSSTSKRSNITDFCKEFEEYLNHLAHLPGKLIITGDFNVHVENPQDSDARKFVTILSNYDLHQHVTSATHISGGFLDLVLTRSNVCDSLNIDNLTITETATSSDHFLVDFSCSFAHQNKSQRVTMVNRKIKDIVISKFKEDILASPINDPSKFQNCDTAVELYNNELKRLLDCHAPQIEYQVNPDQSKWIDSTCQNARRARRKAERTHRRLQTNESKIAFGFASKQAEAILNARRNSFYKNQLEAFQGDKKGTYRIVNKLMDRDLSKNIIPHIKPDDVTADEFKTFFKEKVETIYTEIESNIPCSPKTDKIPDFACTPWSKFVPINQQHLKDTICEINKKDCEEDPIPLKILLQCLDELEPIITFIVNDSLSSGIFPSSLKNALVRPTIKDMKGDINSYKNYRPISNLPFLSKILEKSVYKQLTPHLHQHQLHANHQSGYRPNHSCETATLTIYNDLLCISDLKNKVILLLLDLSAAFDTVNHKLLLNKLYKKFGISGSVLDWFKSYLGERSFTVVINRSRSSKCFLRIGVPQGSILGPILFILYTKELESIAKKHGFNIHLYADDSQMYIEFNPLFQDISSIETRIIDGVNEIKDWMALNKLKINPDKTEALVIQTKNNLHPWSLDKIQLERNDEPIVPSLMVENLGIMFDEYLTFEEQIDSVVKVCNSHLRNLYVIASKLSYELKRQLIHCLIFSKLDYCNGLFYGLPDNLIKKLQKVQNSCARLLFGRKLINKWDNVSPFLKKAHFLPIKQRIKFKIALHVFKCINNIAPEYLKECISIKDQPTKTLRSEDDYFLINFPAVPNYKRTERSFSHCAPVIWNILPYNVRTCTNLNKFKQKLKTYLFNEAFQNCESA